MYWEEEDEQAVGPVPGDIVDLSFRIDCRALPVDHAHALCTEVSRVLPWFGSEAGAALHTIHGAESGNGWYRPENDADDVVYLSRRTRFTLRLPSHRVEAARALTGQTLDIGGHALRIEEATVRPLRAGTTLFARYVVGPADEAEDEFLHRTVAELRALGVLVKKVVCGRGHVIRTPEGELHTRSLMLADLKPADSIRLQQAGIGPARKLGCGVFIPHKGVRKADETLL